MFVTLKALELNGKKFPQGSSVSEVDLGKWLDSFVADGVVGYVDDSVMVADEKPVVEIIKPWKKKYKLEE